MAELQPSYRHDTRSRTRRTSNGRDTTVSGIGPHGDVETASPHQFDNRGTSYAYPIFFEPTSHTPEEYISEDAAQLHSAAHQVDEALEAPVWYYEPAPSAVARGWFCFHENNNNSFVLGECECCADVATVMWADMFTLWLMDRMWWEGLRVPGNLKRAMYEVVKREPWELDDGEEMVAEGNGESRVGLRRDEWECDFCGPECFCWTIDGEDCEHMYDVH